MKKITKIAMFILVGLFFSCQKDNIEVVKNLDTSWQVDPEYVKNDIRTYLGYDPRFKYLYVEEKEKELKIHTISTQKMEGQHIAQVQVNITRESQNDIEVSLNYTPEILEKLKEKYKKFVLADQTKFEILEPKKILKAGQISLFFSVKLTDFIPEENLIIPLSISINTDVEKILENQEKAFIKIIKEEVEFEFEAESEYEAIVTEDGQLSFNGNQTEMEVGVSTSVIFTDEHYSLKLKVNESAEYGDFMSFPANSIQIPTERIKTDDPFVFFKFPIRVNETSRGQHLLPLYLFVINNKTGEEKLLGEMKIYINILENNDAGENPDTDETPVEGNNVFGHVARTSSSFSANDDIKQNVLFYNRTEDGILAFDSELDPEALIDNNLETLGSFTLKQGIKQEVVFTFGETPKITSIQIKMKTKLKSIEVVADNVFQGKVTFSDSNEGDYYTLRFKKPINVELLSISNFEVEKGTKVEIYEISFN